MVTDEGGQRGGLPPEVQRLVSDAERGIALSNAGRWRDGVDLLTRTIEEARTLFGARHPFIADLVIPKADLYIQSGFPGPAEDLLKEALELRSTALGPDHSGVVDSLNRLAILSTILRKFEQAERCYQRVLDAVRSGGGEVQPAFADGLNNLARLREAMGERAEAESLCVRALKILEQCFGSVHPEVAAQIQRLGRLAAKRGEFQQAEALYREALRILGQTVGEHHPAMADGLTWLEALQRHAGDLAEADRTWERALEIRRAALGDRHPAIASNYFDRGSLHALEADHATAERMFRKAAEIWAEALGDHHPNVARALTNLAIVYWATGDYEEARRLQDAGLEIERSCYGDDHPALAHAKANLAGTHIKIGELESAEQLYLAALQIRRATLGPDHPDVAENLNNLGVLYVSMGRLDEAERLCEEALEIRRSIYGDDAVPVAYSLEALGVIARLQGNAELAESRARAGLAIARRLGDRHPLVAHFLNDLAYVSVGSDRIPEAFELLLQVARIHDGFLRQVFSTGSERRRFAYLSRVETSLHPLISLVLDRLRDDRAAVREAFDLVLRRKGIAAEAAAAGRDAILAERYPELATRLREHALLRAEIAQRTLAGPEPGSTEDHEQALAQLSDRKEALERELAEAMPEVDLEARVREADREAVAQRLPEDAALVEFIEIRDTNFSAPDQVASGVDPPRRFVAFILRAGDPDGVQIVDLGDAGPIDELIAGYRDAVTGQGRDRAARGKETAPIEPRTSERRLGVALRAAIFDPLVPHLSGTTRLLLGLDGDLSRLPFEVLPTDTGGRLIEDYVCSYLSTGRDIVRFGASVERGASPVVAAAPDFDLRGAAAVPPPGFRSRDLHPETIHFDPLEGTVEEGTEIAALIGVTPWIGEGVLEARLKASPAPRLLHLATHGFFLPDQGRRPQGDGPDILPEDLGAEAPMRGPGMENPLLRSGIALAGANTFLQGGTPPEEAEDGILTAEDVSGLDLVATEMVVLSACETGLGEVRRGEGVFGLRRGFVLAGARSLVMSLWKVPDRPSAELMRAFYGNLSAGMGRAEALREAQLAMAQMYPPPWFWGAFICQGDPGPLVRAPAAGPAGAEA